MEAIDDLVADSSALIDGYLDPADREQLSHSVRWYLNFAGGMLIDIVLTSFKEARQ